MRTPPRTAVRRLALARAISETGSAAAYTALLDAVFIRSGGSAAWLGLTLLLTHGVAGAFGPFGGVLGDRFDRKRVMILSDLAGSVAFLGLALVHEPGALVAVGFISALAEIPFWTSSAAAIPNVVDKPEDIAWANSLVTAGRNAGITLGPLLGGVLVAAAGQSCSSPTQHRSSSRSAWWHRSAPDSPRIGPPGTQRNTRACAPGSGSCSTIGSFGSSPPPGSWWCSAPASRRLPTGRSPPRSTRVPSGSGCWSPCGAWGRWSARSPRAGSPSEPSPGGSSGAWSSPGWRPWGRGPPRGSRPSWA